MNDFLYFSDTPSSYSYPVLRYALVIVAETPKRVDMCVAGVAADSTTLMRVDVCAGKIRGTPRKKIYRSCPVSAMSFDIGA